VRAQEWGVESYLIAEVSGFFSARRRPFFFFNPPTTHRGVFSPMRGGPLGTFPLFSRQTHQGAVPFFFPRILIIRSLPAAPRSPRQINFVDVHGFPFSLYVGSVPFFFPMCFRTGSTGVAGCFMNNPLFPVSLFVGTSGVVFFFSFFMTWFSFSPPSVDDKPLLTWMNILSARQFLGALASGDEPLLSGGVTNRFFLHLGPPHPLLSFRGVPLPLFLFPALKPDGRLSFFGSHGPLRLFFLEVPVSFFFCSAGQGPHFHFAFFFGPLAEFRGAPVSPRRGIARRGTARRPFPFCGEASASSFSVLPFLI